MAWFPRIAHGVALASLMAIGSLSSIACGSGNTAGTNGSGAAPAAPQTPTPPTTKRSIAQGGEGRTRVLLVTFGHPFDEARFFELMESFGADITYTHVEQPAAHALFDPMRAKPYDVVLMYDWSVGVPSPELQKNFSAMLREGKGMVFLHHAIASFDRTWPEYSEVVGGACDNKPVTVRGIPHPPGQFIDNVPQHITVVDKTHPVVKGLGDGYDIIDETYYCPMFEDSVHPLLRTDYVSPNPIKNLGPKTPYSNMVGWVKTAENSPIVYLENGHGRSAYENPAFRTLLLNSLQWAASAEALAWAKANPTRIFK